MHPDRCLGARDTKMSKIRHLAFKMFRIWPMKYRDPPKGSLCHPPSLSALAPQHNLGPDTQVSENSLWLA